MALIGLMSDSHGEWLRTRSAITLLTSAKCEKILHMGDVETHEVLDELAGHPVSLVFGNCDCPSRLSEYAATLGIEVLDPASVVEFGGKTIAFLHGHDFEQYEAFIENPEIEIVVHGHTHEKRDEIVNKTRCINPGALHRASVYTVAVLDTTSGILEFLEVEA